MTTQASILIVDDDPSILEVLDARLGASGFCVFKANDAAAAVRILGERPVDLMVSDVKMPNQSGMDLLRHIRSVHPGLPVIFLTAYGTIPDAVDAMKLGAVDYMCKPFDGRELTEKIQQILARPPRVRTVTEGDLPQKSAGGCPAAVEDGFFWGRSRAMTALYAMVRKAAATTVNILILGESGVGKERIARVIHQKSPRAGQDMVVVDCGATPAGILESELFGHLKGSFTHAVKDKPGLIQASDRGTLFLDEIGNISHEMQCRLLRFLEDGKIRQVGSVQEKKVDARVISATNADLAAAIEAGVFRQDLYYRLKGVTLTIPPLRERKEDILDLCRLFLDRFSALQKREPVTITSAAMAKLESHSWPGNVRELKNTIETGAVLCQSNRIDVSDLQIEPSRQERPEGLPDPFSIEQSEKMTIIRALTEARGIQTKAADLLNISKRAIHYKIRKYRIQPEQYK